LLAALPPGLVGNVPLITREEATFDSSLFINPGNQTYSKIFRYQQESPAPSSDSGDCLTGWLVLLGRESLFVSAVPG